jgi:hypothetical protein
MVHGIMLQVSWQSSILECKSCLTATPQPLSTCAARITCSAHMPIRWTEHRSCVCIWSKGARRGNMVIFD